MASLAKPTTITVTERTRRRLQAIKREGESYDELIEALLEEASFDSDFYAEIERRWKSDRRVPAETVYRTAGLL